MKSLTTQLSIVLFLTLSICSTQLRALEQIQDEFWFFEPGIPMAPGYGEVRVVFDAIITQTDLNSGITFSVVEGDENGGVGTVLWNLVLNDITDLPAAGTPINVQVLFRVACNSAGRLVANIYGTYLSYCHPTMGAVSRRISGFGQGSVGEVAAEEAYEFGLLDENGVAGPNRIPENSLFCSDGGIAAVSPEIDAWEKLSQAKSKRLSELLAPEDSGSLGVYFDEEGTQCSGTIQPGVPGTVFVIAKTRGFTECGIAGAEFQFAGVPESWQMFAVPDPNIISFGDPFGDGATIAFPCVNPSNGGFVLYRVLVIASEFEPDVKFSLVHRKQPTNQSLRCPILTLCDAPIFTGLCVESIPCFVNSRSPKGCTAVVAVAEETWSSVKQLFQ